MPAVVLTMIALMYGYSYFKEDIKMMAIIITRKHTLNNFLCDENTIFHETLVDTPTVLPVLHMTHLRWLNSPQLPRALPKEQHDSIIEFLYTFSKLLAKVNVTMLLSSGTLLGSFIFHDIVPWDDDLDIMIACSDIPKLKTLATDPEFANMYAFYDFNVVKNFPVEQNYNSVCQYLLNEFRGLFFKFYKKDNPKADKSIYTIFRKIKWTFPFIDIQCYIQNTTHVAIMNRSKHKIVMKISDFFPIHPRPLYNQWFYAPRSTQEFLYQHYHHFKCQPGMDHRQEAPKHIYNVDCSRLAKYYPIVRRKQVGEQVVEELMFNHKQIHEFVIHGEHYALQQPFFDVQ